jgi:hypothetical protein
MGMTGFGIFDAPVFGCNPGDMRPASDEDINRIRLGAQQASQQDMARLGYQAQQYRYPAMKPPQGWADWFAIGDLLC